jgi:hypothetical protein
MRSIDVVLASRLILPSFVVTLCPAAVAASPQTTEPLPVQNAPANPLLAITSIALASDDPRSSAVEVRAASKGLSFELAQTFTNESIPIPRSLRLKQTILTQEELAVVVWLKAHQGEIALAEAKFGITRQAIAGVIAWEAIENVAPLSVRSVGPGKVHICNMSTVDCETALRLNCGRPGSKCPPNVKGIDETVGQEVEALGLLPPRSLQERIDLLKTSSGAIKYVAAILRAGADAARDAGWEIAGDPTLLAAFYRGYTVRTWRNLLRTLDHTSPRLVIRDGNGNEKVDAMGAWIRRKSVLLADGVGASSIAAESEPDTSGFLSRVARQAANQPDVRDAQQSRETEIRRPDTTAEDDARAERRAAAWEYLRATMDLACSDPDNLKTLREERRYWGVILSRETVGDFFRRDREAMRPCAIGLAEALLRSNGPADVHWIEKQGRKSYDKEMRAIRQEIDAAKRAARAERAREESERSRESYSRASESVSRASSGGGRLGEAYGQAVGIAGGGANRIFDGRR